MTTTSFPDWVLRYREKGTEVKRINGRYYLYKVRGEYDASAGVSRKVSEAYLGKLTPDGLVKPKQERTLEAMKEVSVKEYGASSLILSVSTDLIELLKRHYPDEWKELFVMAAARFFHASPLKNVLAHYSSSHLSDALDGATVSPESLSRLLGSVGLRRERAVGFMSSFVTGGQAVMDLTHIFSLSEGVISATLGHNGDGEYLPQVNLVLLLSLEEHHPSFFRLVPGSISDVSTIRASVREAGLSGALVIGDKALYSKGNAASLEQGGLAYILPLKRNSKLVNYAPTRSGDRRKFDGHFLFDERTIWYKESVVSGGGTKRKKRRVILFLDEGLKAEEEKDFMINIRDRKLTMAKYYERQYSMGTIAVITNSLSFGAQRTFELLKERIDIEQVFDTFKNTLHADRSYVRDDAHLQGWMLVNFIALLLYYRVYELLRKNEALDDYSPRDVVMHLSRAYKLRVGERWFLSEIPKQTRTVMERLKISFSIP